MDPDLIVHQSCSCGNNRVSKFKTYQNDRGELLGAFCTFCGNEWLQKQFLLNEKSSGNSVLLKHQELFHRKRREVSSSYRRVRDFEEIKLGDHVRWEEYQGREQSFPEAIVVGWEAGDTLVSVVTMQKQGFCKIKIGRMLLNLSKITKIEVADFEPSADPFELVKARAMAWCDEESEIYNLFTMKGNIFASYCKHGSGDKWKITWLAGSQFTQVTMTVLGSSWKVGKEDDSQTIAEKGSTKTRIKTGIVVVANGVAIAFDMEDIIKEKQDVADPEKIVNCYIERFGEVLTDRGYNINGALAHNVHGGGIDSIGFPTIDVKMSVFIASILKGKIPSAPQNAFGTPGGRAFGKLIHMSLKRGDEYVDLKNIHPGDHVVLPGRIRHPRCHAIVVSVNVKSNKLMLIRNTFEKGVVEEWVEVSSPILRVVYPLGQTYPAETVIQRARSKLGERRYLFARYNCKHFAVWCESKEQA